MSSYVPNGWCVEKLDQISRVIDSAHKTPIFSETGYPMVRVGDIKGGKVTLENTKYVPQDIFKIFTKNHLPTFNDLLMTRVGSYGRCSIVKSKREFCLGQNTVVINPKSVDSDYLYHFLQTENINNQIEDTVGGSSQKSLSLAAIKSLNILTPIKPEQQKIAQILTSVDEVIEKTQAQIDKLKDLKTGMMQELLTKGIGHSEFKDSPVGRIPFEWKIVKLRDVAVEKGLQTGPFGAQLHAHEYVEQGIPVIMPKDMKKNRVVTGTIARITSDKAEGLERHKVKIGDILFSRRGDIGRFVLIEKKNEGWICGTGCLKARLNDSIEPSYLASYLNLLPVVEWLNNNAVGQTMLNLNTSILSELPVILPPKNEQKTIANTIESLDLRTSSLYLKYEKLQSIKKALMQDLLTGKVRVNTAQTTALYASDVNAPT